MPSRPQEKPTAKGLDRKRVQSKVVHPGEIFFSSERNIGTALRETYFAFGKAMTKLLARDGINLGMWFVLRTLWNEDGLSQGVIAKRTAMTAPSVVALVNALERASFVRRVRREADRRVSGVYLTREGKMLEARLTTSVLPLNTEALEGFSRAEVAGLLEMLGRLRTNITRVAEDI